MQGGVELLVDGGAHLLKLGGIVRVELREAVAHGGAELFLMLGVGGVEGGETIVQRFAVGGLNAVGVTDRGGKTLGDPGEILRDGDAERFRGGGGFAAVGFEAGVEGLGQVADGAGELIADGERVRGGVVAVGIEVVAMVGQGLQRCGW